MLEEDPVQSSCLTARFKTVKTFFLSGQYSFLFWSSSIKMAQQRKFYSVVVKEGTHTFNCQTRYDFFHPFQRTILTLPS